MQEQRIAIVGGGLVGATLAISLDKLAQKFNWQIDVFEAVPYKSGSYTPSFDGRCSAMSYGTFKIYQDLGLADKFLEAAYPIEHIEVSDGNKKTTTQMHASEQNVDALGYMVANAWLGETLWHGLSKCKNVNIHSPVKIENINFVQAGGSLVADNGETYTADLIVLVDGGGSGLKQKLGIADSVSDYGQNAIFAGVELNREHKGWAYERFVKGGAVALLPMQGKKNAIVWTQPRERAEELMQMQDSEFLKELQHLFGDRAGLFTSVSPRGFYPLRLVRAKEQSRKNLVLLGNAAHYLHPVAGQGYNLAIRGVVDLVKHLEIMQMQGKSLGDFDGLQTYVKARQADQLEVIGFSHSLIKLFESEQVLAGIGRRAGMSFLNKTNATLNYIAKRGMGI